jgi:predicted TIM-barrel fold metal-dependent hydrolase
MSKSGQICQRIFDPHIHLFDLQHGEYAWLQRLPPERKSIIARNFGVHDLRLPSHFSLAGFVHVEAGFDNHQPWRELAYWEQRYNSLFCSIACVDLLQAPSDFGRTLKRLAEHASFVGVRHILDADALHILREPNAQRNLAQLNEQGLVFELQIQMLYVSAKNEGSANKQQEMLNLIIETFSPLSNLKIVLNHAGFMPINTALANSAEGEGLKQQYLNEYGIWQQAMLTLAGLPNLYVKCSGWEMTNADYKTSDIERGLGFLLNTFGSQRLMLASNFPLVLFAKSYAEYWQCMQAAVTAVNADFETLSFENSKRIYVRSLA